MASTWWLPKGALGRHVSLNSGALARWVTQDVRTYHTYMCTQKESKIPK